MGIAKSWIHYNEGLLPKGLDSAKKHKGIICATPWYTVAWNIFNRPGVAGAVLQSPLLLNN